MEDASPHHSALRHPRPNAVAAAADVVVVGGGVVGCAVLRELARYRLDLFLLERESDVAEGITKANSGVIHAGFNVPPGSLKAKTNVAGLSLTYALAEALGVPHRKTGKLVLALSDAERPALERLRAAGDRSGVPGLEIVDEAAIRSLEPRARGRWALFSPHTGIVSPYELAIAQAENAARNGARVLLETPVVAVEPRPEEFILRTPRGDVAARWVVNAAGLSADQVAALAGAADFRVFPYRGEYLIADRNAGFDLRMPVYPVPPADERSGLGVHVTPTMEGNVLVGPSSEFVTDRRDVATTRAVMDALRAEAAQLMPDLARAPFIKSYAGVRPKLVDPAGGEAFRDFIVEESRARPRWINLAGIESPGLTAAPAIAALVAGIIGAKEDLRLKPDFDGERPAAPRFAHLDDEERRRRVAADPRQGEMVCRCEHVTRAEVEAALRNPLGARTFDAVKRRTRCGMGRCQGGFCGSRIVRIMQDEGIALEAITKRGGGSRLSFGRVKP